MSSKRPPLAETLDLQPHPEGGWFRETWRAAPTFVPEGYSGERNAATGIYFLLQPGEESRWHKVRSDEMWFWHHGGPLQMSLGGVGTEPDAEPGTFVLGGDVEDGQHPQLLVPGGYWQAARPLGDDPVLVSCVVAPGFDFSDFRLLADDA
jgi:predicted cupin superfamily sugar epimerase